MARRTASVSAARVNARRQRDGYASTIRQPLPILLFLLPLILAYEACLIFVLRSGDGQSINTVQAHHQMIRLFSSLGIAPAVALHLGGIAIVLVLLAWHLLARARWRMDLRIAILMGVESLLLALPLLLAGRLIARHVAVAGVPGLQDLDLLSQMAISVGAGLYEELIFRMVLIAVIHTLLVDFGRFTSRTGSIAAVLVSAVAFTLYHPLRLDDGTISTRRIIFYMLAGLWFGAIYLLRGFGISVGTHALYDILVVSLAAIADSGD